MPWGCRYKLQPGQHAFSASERQWLVDPWGRSLQGQAQAQTDVIIIQVHLRRAVDLPEVQFEEGKKELPNARCRAMVFPSSGALNCKWTSHTLPAIMSLLSQSFSLLSAGSNHYLGILLLLALLLCTGASSVQSYDLQWINSISPSYEDQIQVQTEMEREILSDYN